MNPEFDFVVLEGNQGKGKTWVAAEGEEEGNVEVGNLTTGGCNTINTLGTNKLVKESLHIGIVSKFGPDVHPARVVAVNHLSTNAEFNVVEEAETNAVNIGVRVGITCECGKSSLDVDAVE